jgi:quinol monooxygenase YgiN
MSVVVVLDLTAKDGQLDNLLEALHQILPDTKAFEGCLLLKMCVYEGENKVGLIEEWETKAHQEAYMAWRMGNNQLVEPHLESFGIAYADVKNTY